MFYLTNDCAIFLPALVSGLLKTPQVGQRMYLGFGATKTSLTSGVDFFLMHFSFNLFWVVDGRNRSAKD